MTESHLVYHYCDLHTFISIVRRGELWLADISKSNDSMELDWAARMFRREATAIVREHLSWGSSLAQGGGLSASPTGFDPGAATSYLASPSIGPGSSDFLRCYAMWLAVALQPTDFVRVSANTTPRFTCANVA